MQEFDDGIRDTTTVEGLAGLQPVFAAGGSVTAGNSSQTTDGAAAAVLMSEDKVKELGVQPIAKLKYYTVIGCEPDEMGVGPRYAIPKLLDMAGMKIDDIGLFEINEAFASQAVYSVRELGIDREKVNVNGGAIALGHPIGASGARVLVSLLHEMQRRDARRGLATLCIGGGQGVAMAIERG